MKDSIWNKRIPTLLGLTIITIGIVFTSVLVQTGVITIGRAAPSENPENVRITNVSATSFTVSYTTQASVLGTLSYGTTSNYGSIGFDDRDQANETSGAYTLHYITVKNLQPETLYFFSITSGKNTYLHNGAPFQITTGPTLTTEPPNQQPASGKIVLPNGTTPSEAIVYISSSGTETLSALTKPDGSFILPLNSLRSENLTSYAILGKDQVLNMLAITQSQQSNVTLLPTQLNPIPAVTLSQDYNFTLSTTPIASPSAQTSFPSFSATVSDTSPQILTPKKDQGFSDTQPQFKGTAQPGEDVQIIIHSSQEIKTTITANNNGSWAYRPPEDLTPGEHTITITTRDATGIMKTIMRPFTVYAAGNQVSQSATPSATLAPKPTSTPTPTAIPTVGVPTPTPTTFVQPTPTTVIQPTPTPVLVIQTTKGGEPEAPGSTSTMILGIAAIITTSFGILLFFFTRRTIRI
jgi:hypothetical protein